MDASITTPPSLGRAVGALAETAIDQMRDLAVAQIDEWAGCLQERLAAPRRDVDAASPPSKSSAVHPLVIGALAGATLGWLLVKRAAER
jgi:hypothetical protein